MPTQVFYHATTADYDAIDLSQTVDGGFHLGTEAQARMRGGRQARMLTIEANFQSVHRSRDQGGNWAARVRRARSAGHDAIVYLNRYEGLSLDRVLEADRDGVDLDRLSDTAFRKRVPEAQDSYIALFEQDLRITASVVPSVVPRYRINP